MKKLIFMVAIAIFLTNVAIAQQDDLFTGKDNSGVKKEKEVKIKVEKSNEKKLFLLPDFALNIDANRGFVIGGGVRFTPGSKKIRPQYLSLNLSIPFSKGNNGLGIAYKTYPFGGSFGRMIGIGADAIVFFKADYNKYSEWFFGGKVSNTLGTSDGFFETKRLVIAPRLDITYPYRNFKFGISSNPLVIGYWDYSDHKFGDYRRWYNVSLMVQWTVLTKKFKNFKEAEQEKKQKK
ncbi:MAG: hypothetical protein WCX46_04435 [Candidatus Paceibacterota bacterium]